MVDINITPFFSIIVPTHNRPHLLKRAILSVIVQNFNNLEFIIINDGSSVSYDQVLENYAFFISHYIRSEASQGAANARNSGILMAKGEWVVFLDDDDEFLPGYLHSLKEYINNNIVAPAFIWPAVKSCLYDGNGEVIATNIIDYSSVAENAERLRDSCIKVGSGYGLAIKRSIFSDVGLFDTSYIAGEDTELIIRMLASSVQPHYIPTIGVVIHNHLADRLSFNHKNCSEKNICERIIARHADFFRDHQKIHFDLLSWCVHVHYTNHNFGAGDAALAKIYPLLSSTVECIEEYLKWKLIKLSIKHEFLQSPILKTIALYRKLMK